MRIRHKLLTLMLFFAVIPLLLNIAISHTFFYAAGLHLAEEAESGFSDQAHTTLKKLVEGFQQLQERDRRMIETAIILQTEFSMKGAAERSITTSSTPLAYTVVNKYRPGTVSRQITILETGDISCYPSHDQCFEGSDPKQIPWYQALQKSKVRTHLLEYDPVSEEPVIIFATPLTEEGGRFAGVTALVRPVKAMFGDLLLSKNWLGATREMLVVMDQMSEGSIRILTVRETGASEKIWQGLQPQAILQPDTSAEALLLLQKLEEGQGGSLELSFQGVKTHWIFSAAAKGEPFALILVPHSQINARAIATKKHMINQTLRGLAISGVLLAVTILAVFFIAILASKKLTLPLRQLATTAGNLAGGDFQAQVEISTGDEVEELGQVFNQLGPALAEHERMASSLALAGDIQRHLLPQSQPQIKGFEISGGTLPCDETGGDYYDFIPLGGDRLALAVGDVSGHGAGAALLMAGARGALRSHALRHAFSLSQLFAVMNEHLCRDTADEQFMTLFYGVLNDSDRTLRWCSAGHGPVFLYRSGEQTIIELGSTGLPLGIIKEATWVEGDPVFFDVGDILLIGTDGVWEVRNTADEILGTERLKSELICHTFKSASQIHASIMELARRFRGENNQEDDVTLSVIKAV